MQDAAIIRNRRKIEAAVTNAEATIALRGRYGAGTGLSEFVWSFQPSTTPRPATVAEAPTVSAESTALSKALKKEGSVFVGPTTTHALMERRSGWWTPT